MQQAAGGIANLPYYVTAAPTVATVRAMLPRILSYLCLSVSLIAGENWPQFRGPAGDGQATRPGCRLKFSETENVKWKTAIHGKAWSSPVIWGSQVWLTTATEDGTELSRGLRGQGLRQGAAR